MFEKAFAAVRDIKQAIRAKQYAAARDIKQVIRAKQYAAVRDIKQAIRAKQYAAVRGIVFSLEDGGRYSLPSNLALVDGTKR